ncbi:hypothetical protein [Marinilabilia salmonicolor]|uniref:hypothetical protein n=1 Tax=Marinilabilia salmonicolor TaxID=989 RepID=UPI00029B3435|nr:hypothetical protein [Marinilabilia salmonicolor]
MKVNYIGAQGTSKPDKHLLNELLSDGHTIEEITNSFPISEEQILKTLNGTPMSYEDAVMADLLGRNESRSQECWQDNGFSKREIQESIDYLPNKEQRMKRNGYYEDRFIWDKPNKGELKAQNAEEKEYGKLEYDEWDDMINSYETILKEMNSDCRRTINPSNSLSKEDAINDIMVECLSRGKYITKTGMIYQATRTVKKRNK